MAVKLKNFKRERLKVLQVYKKDSDTNEWNESFGKDKCLY